jgi:hypothetical protein
MRILSEDIEIILEYYFPEAREGFMTTWSWMIYIEDIRLLEKDLDIIINFPRLRS